MPRNKCLLRDVGANLTRFVSNEEEHERFVVLVVLVFLCYLCHMVLLLLLYLLLLLLLFMKPVLQQKMLDTTDEHKPEEEETSSLGMIDNNQGFAINEAFRPSPPTSLPSQKPATFLPCPRASRRLLRPKRLPLLPVSTQPLLLVPPAFPETPPRGHPSLLVDLLPSSSCPLPRLSRAVRPDGQGQEQRQMTVAATNK